jgi:uncharacterized membrane protein YphA (DoxX/SURF4 family)
MNFFSYLLSFFNVGSLILRVVIGVIFVYHAAPKLLSPKLMAAGIKWPPLIISILGLTEAIAGAALIAGWYEQQAALVLSVVMVGALFYKIIKWKIPFSSTKATGWEFDLMLLAACLYIVLSGGGNIGV